MKVIKFLFVIMLLVQPLTLIAQASGGQIRRHVKSQSNNTQSRAKTSAKTRSNRTYTVKEQYEMGSSYYDKGNYTEAFKWYTQAAENGYIDAQSELGFMYLNGEGVAVNKPEAVKWLTKAGEQGDVMAQRALGYLYKNGDGVYRSESEAYKWFKKAAPKFYELSKTFMKSGNSNCVDFFESVIDMEIIPYNIWSWFHLGAMYYYGEGGQRIDFLKAYHYFKLAADKSCMPAMYYVGLCYEYGRGVPKDISKAKEYYEKSRYKELPSRDF